MSYYTSVCGSTVHQMLHLMAHLTSHHEMVEFSTVALPLYTPLSPLHHHLPVLKEACRVSCRQDINGTLHWSEVLTEPFSIVTSPCRTGKKPAKLISRMELVLFLTYSISALLLASLDCLTSEACSSPCFLTTTTTPPHTRTQSGTHRVTSPT